MTDSVSVSVSDSAPADSGDLYRLQQGVHSVATPQGELHLAAWPRSQFLGALTATQRSVLRALAAGPHSLADLTASAPDDAADIRDLVDRLDLGGWLCTTVVHEGRPLYTIDPNTPVPSAPPVPVPEGLRLSRFTVMRRADGDLVLESPRAWCEVRIHDSEAAASVTALICGAEAGSLPFAPAARLATVLYRAGLAVGPDDPEDSEAHFQQWSVHEAWFHDRSRMGNRKRTGFGRTDWSVGRYAPLPERPEPYPGPAVELAKPDLDLLRKADPPLTAVLEDRRSLREHDDDRPISVEQLGEFLYRCARERKPGPGGDPSLSPRPYPAGSGGYEIEIYPLVRHVQGLAPGMYHYDPAGHRLVLVCPPSPALRRMTRVATAAARIEQPPQVQLVLAARFGRVFLTYEAMAYALTLKHVGVLYQTMYTVATAMGLAACALGAGDSGAFAEATGRGGFQESSVGEFMLGTPLTGGSGASGSAGQPPRGSGP